MNKIAQIADFAWFMLKSTNQHGIHSPYLFDFYNQVITDERDFYAFAQLNIVRASYLSNLNEIEIVELGAGSSYNNKRTKTISEIAKQQLSSDYQLRVIYRIVDWMMKERSSTKGLQLVELGSSLGLSTFYLALASANNQVTSFEGNSHFIQFIEYQKQQLGIENVQMIEGNFDKTFIGFCQERNHIDIAFIDGNHREDATIRYFEESLACIDEGSVLIFDDIHWSTGMKRAWEQIKGNPRVTATIDMYFMGIVFFRRDFQEKRHLRIRPKKVI